MILNGPYLDPLVCLWSNADDNLCTINGEVEIPIEMRRSSIECQILTAFNLSQKILQINARETVTHGVRVTRKSSDQKKAIMQIFQGKMRPLNVTRHQ